MPADEGQRLERLFQLTGWSDPVYAEAYINVQQYDIVLEVLILNRTADTLQNVSMELSTMGDLKLCERPQNYTIPPFGSVQIKADIKASTPGSSQLRLVCVCVPSWPQPLFPQITSSPPRLSPITPWCRYPPRRRE
jgi:hypothetical protein